MTILHVADWVNGGLATYLQTVCDAQSLRHQVSILASESGSESRITNRSGFVSLDPYDRCVTGVWHAFLVTRKVIQKVSPDILYVHSSFAGIFARLAVLGLPKRPKVIYCAHGWSFLMQGNRLKSWIYRVIERGLSYSSDAIVTISENEHLKALEAGIPKERLYHIAHGISLKAEPLKPYVKAEQFEKQKYNILFLGRYDYAKGFDWLMSFIARFPQEHICWHCAGKSVINHTVAIPEGVVNHGWVDYQEIPQLLLRCDMVIMPSRWEGFGFSAIEAMAYSKPVIASMNGALPELIEPECNGWLFDMQKEQTLVNILENLHVDRVKACGAGGYDIVRRRYDAVNMVAMLEQVMQQVVSSKEEHL